MSKDNPINRVAGLRALSLRLLAFVRLGAAVGLLVLVAPAFAQSQSPIKIAVHATLKGAEEPYGRSLIDSARLAVEEANKSGREPPILLETYDDEGNPERAAEVAKKIAASDAQVVLGPVLSTSSLAAGPIFAQASIASIVSTAESDLITDNATSFRTIFKNSDIGEWLASYLRFALRGSRAVVIFVDNGYGRTIRDGFQRGAERLGLPVASYGFSTAAERDDAVRRAAAEPGSPGIVLAMLDQDAATAVMALRRLGAGGPVLGGTGMVESGFTEFFKDQPEERKERGFFTRNIYAARPVILDSANARTLAFAERWRARFGQSRPPIFWVAVQGHDAARLAIAAARQAARERPTGDLAARRDLVGKYLVSLDGPSRALPGLLGPIWFTPDRGRSLPIRIGRFSDGRFESAPVQLVPVSRPSPDELASGDLVEIGPGRYAHRQEVVYTGMYLNELSRIDIAQSTFTADVYVWVRYARNGVTADADPTQIEFPDLVRGNFDSRRPAAQRDLDDGTTYRLWRVTGDFKNDYDLHRYPIDRQFLDIHFFNARAASDRLVYVVDGSSPETTDADRPAARSAFRNLSQWQAMRVAQARDSLVTESAVGDPSLLGAERVRELSGFTLDIEVRRDVDTTIIKTLLPIGLMTLILFATLYFPPGMAVAKVTVAITAALSGAVLLSSINAQLGSVGYVIAVEYGFYVFFLLCLVCILTVLVTEQRRLSGRSVVAVEWTGRILFLLGLIGTIVAAVIVFWRWQ